MDKYHMIYQGWESDLSIDGAYAKSDYFRLYGSIEAALSTVALKNNKTLYVSGISGKLKKEGLLEIDSLITKEFNGSKIVEDNFSNSNSFVYKINNYTYALVKYSKNSSDSSNINLMSFDKTLLDNIFNTCKKIIKAEKTSENGEVYVLTSSPSGTEITELGIAGIPLERDNYSEEVLESVDHIVEDLNTLTPCGRLSIFDGPPGCGKTFAVKHLIKNCPNCLFVLIPPDMVSSLHGPNLMNTLLGNLYINERSLVLIVEDADSVLASRGSDNMGGIYSLLNFGSGLVGDTIDIRVVCTTNAKKKEMDSAILRSGRLCKHVHFPALDFDHALRVFNRLTNRQDDNINGKKSGSMTLADVYKCAREHGWRPEPIENSQIGFQNTQKREKLVKVDIFSGEEIE